MEEAFSTVLDSSEGAGFGILILMLEKIGLDEDAFNIESESGETVASITVPFADVHLDKVTALTNRIVGEVQSLPQFPENIIYLQKLIDDPESEIADVARQISRDPSLTADLLKIVNSAEFMLPHKVDKFVEAVKMAGFRRLKNLLYSFGTQKVLGERYSEMRSMWGPLAARRLLRLHYRQGFQAETRVGGRYLCRWHAPRPWPDRRHLAPPGFVGLARPRKVSAGRCWRTSR